MSASRISKDLFRRACGQFATGVIVATVLDDQMVPHGITINSFTSVSLAPPLVLISISEQSAVLPRFLSAKHYALNILSEAQKDLSMRFATKVEDRFEGIEWERGETAVPILKGAVASLECEVRDLIEAGDHMILLAEVITARVAGGDPLIYCKSRYASVKA